MKFLDRGARLAAGTGSICIFDRACLENICMRRLSTARCGGKAVYRL